MERPIKDNDKKRPRPVINSLECKGCERCVLACPVGALEMGDRLNERGYRFAIYQGKGCTGCGSCYYTCPDPNALEVHIPVSAETKGKEC